MKSFGTVVTLSHLNYVGSLFESLRSSGNNERMFVLVADANQDELPPDSEGLVYFGFDRIESQLPPLLRYYYDPFELSNSLKPYLIGELFAHFGATHVIYLDSDLLITGSFARVWEGFGSTSLLVSPHQFGPPALGNGLISEVNVADMGFLNGGFAAWRGGAAADRMLSWMRTRFVVQGFCDRQHGMFVDQKLLPLLLQYFPDDVRILRDPGINIAFWNAYERNVHQAADGRWRVGDSDVLFFHLSGYRLKCPGVPCTYLEPATNEGLLRQSPWMKEVLAQYHEVLQRHQSDNNGGAYKFDRYKGVKLTQEFRRLLFTKGDLDRRTFAFWRVWAREFLRVVKRRLLR